jgi:RinA family phage transcriptional activator
MTKKEYNVSGRGGGQVKLSRAVFRYIEHELYNYDTTLVEIENIRVDIIEAPPLRETIPSSGHISDPTARKGTQLVTNTALVRMTRTVAAIDKALARLSDNHRALFNLKYRQDLPWQQVCQELPTSERSYFRMRRELVQMVALEMGLAGSWQE